MALFGALGDKKETAAPLTGPGLGPNKFDLQMTGGTPRPTIGFGPGSHTFAAQTQGLNLPTQAPGVTEAPAPEKSDPFDGMGLLGDIFRWIDKMRTDAGMPALADNQQMMGALRTGLDRSRLGSG